MVRDKKRPQAVARLRSGDENERKEYTHMNDTTKKPVAQGLLRYGHFFADVKVYSRDDVQFEIGMSKRMHDELFDKYFEESRWVQTLETEMHILMGRIRQYPDKVLDGEYIPSDWGISNAV